MASLLLHLQNPVPTNIAPNMHSFSSSSSYSLSIFPENSNKKPSKVSTNGKHYYYPYNNISCKSTNGGGSSSGGDHHKFDRRNVLLGLGGLYSIAGNLGTNRLAIADDEPQPVQGPDIQNCGDATISPTNPTTIQYSCCPKYVAPVAYEIPTWSTTRTRPAAQWVSVEYMAKYSKAVKKMKNLPPDNPHNFYNQAEIHCAYCNGAYHQLWSEDPTLNLDLQVHSNWMFLPFHRWYLYFFERIVAMYTRDDGQLDEDFALPFWNWDNPSGMMIPPLYLNPFYALHDCYRNGNHLDKLIDLDHGDSSGNLSNADRIADNLSIVHNTMFDNSHTGFGLFGGVFSGGQEPPTEPGSLELTHNMVHKWTGDPNQPYGEDMGNFYSAAKDPIFYGHHANVDRLWSTWKTLDTTKNTDPTEKAWTDSTLVFYDENKKLVSVKLGDCADTKNLGYEYEPVDITPWKDFQPTTRVFRSTVAARSASTEAANVVFPVTLNKVVSVLVKRLSKSRSKEAKVKEAEVLVLEGIKYDMNKFVQFDVYVNDEDEKEHAKHSNTEFLGSFSSVPHRGKDGMKGTAKLRLGLTKKLEDLGADDDDAVVVKLVPREGAEDITVDAIKIQLSSK